MSEDQTEIETINILRNIIKELNVTLEALTLASHKVFMTNSIHQTEAKELLSAISNARQLLSTTYPNSVFAQQPTSKE